MITKIFFKNYRAFKEEQELELRPITILVGKNSSGKSSICQLIEMLSDTFVSSEKNSKKLTDAIIEAGSSIFTVGDLTSLMIGAENEFGTCVKAQYSHMNGQNFLTHCDVIIEETLHQHDFLPRFKSKSSNPKLLRRLKELDAHNVKSLSFSVNHIGPIRKLGNHIIPNTSYSQNGVGYYGEATCSMLVNSFVEGTDVYKNTAMWFAKNLEGQGLSITRIPIAYQTQYQIGIQRKEISINEVGEGMRQVLPIITESYNPIHADVTIIEQPVLHLHPAAHASVMNCIAMSAKKNARKYVIETHSGNSLLELRRMVSDKNCPLNSSDVIAYFVDMVDGEARLKKIEFLETGELSYWPSGVFGESFDLLAQIMNNQHL